MPKVIPSSQTMRALLLEILQHPPTDNIGMGEKCFYCDRYIWGNGSYGDDFDFAPQHHAPHCLIARIGLLFPKESKDTPAFPPSVWQTRQPFTMLLRDFPDGTKRYAVRCNKCLAEHLLPAIPDVLFEDDGFRAHHARICHADLLEAIAEERAAEDRFRNPPCPSCGKPSSPNQLARLGFCRRCEIEKRNFYQAWIDLFEQVFKLPITMWRSYDEIKPTRK